HGVESQLCKVPFNFSIERKIEVNGTLCNIQYRETAGRDCSDIWQKNSNAVSGVYLIKPNGANAPFQVSCEMTKSGGWTLMQYRDGSGGVSFNQKWKTGTEQQLMYLTTLLRTASAALGGHSGPSSKSALHGLILQAIYWGEAWQYTDVSYCSGGDSFKGMSLPGFNQYGRFFSTEDSPHDGCTPNCLIDDIMYESCSKIFSSGWWFNACGFAKLNGYYWTPPGQEHQMSSLFRPTWRKYDSLKSTKMSINCK
ncbi:angiopoietin-related protein 4-like, partial [Aquarana catesbeiana]|uniref:angiopoietin-related protein 4-like n=1 Tax=Aquarana catesbeiana TaxID=8400 RepID=UPI003CC93ADF